MLSYIFSSFFRISLVTKLFKSTSTPFCSKLELFSGRVKPFYRPVKWFYRSVKLLCSTVKLLCSTVILFRSTVKLLRSIVMLLCSTVKLNLQYCNTVPQYNKVVLQYCKVVLQYNIMALRNLFFEISPFIIFEMYLYSIVHNLWFHFLKNPGTLLRESIKRWLRFTCVCVCRNRAFQSIRQKVCCVRD